MLRQNAFLALLLLAIALVLFAFDAKDPVYPFRGIGAYDGTPVSMFAATSGSADQYMTFESPSGTDLSVTTGETLRITRLVFECSDAGAGCEFVIGYGDDGVALGASAPTNPVSLIGQHGASPASPISADVQNQMVEVDIYAEVPAGKFPFVQVAGTISAIQAFGTTR